LTVPNSSTLMVQNCPIGTLDTAWLGTSYMRVRRCLVLKIISRGMPTLSTSQLQAKHVLHWLEKGTRQRCHVCSAQKKQSKTTYACLKCNMAICVMPCFKIHVLTSTHIERSKSHTW
jgi:hypothetical protein